MRCLSFNVLAILVIIGSVNTCHAGMLKGGDWLSLKDNEKICYLIGYYDGDGLIRSYAEEYGAILHKQGVNMTGERAKSFGYLLFGGSGFNNITIRILKESLDYIYSINELKNIPAPLVINIWKDVINNKINNQEGLSRLIAMSKVVDSKNSSFDN